MSCVCAFKSIDTYWSVFEIRNYVSNQLYFSLTNDLVYL